MVRACLLKEEFKVNKIALAAVLAAITSGAAFADAYSITATNNLDNELLAPIVVTDASNDGRFFDGAYVTPEAEEGILTGDPGKVVGRIGAGMAAV